MNDRRAHSSKVSLREQKQNVAQHLKWTTVTCQAVGHMSHVISKSNIGTLTPALSTLAFRECSQIGKEYNHHEKTKYGSNNDRYQPSFFHCICVAKPLWNTIRKATAIHIATCTYTWDTHIIMVGLLVWHVSSSLAGINFEAIHYNYKLNFTLFTS